MKINLARKNDVGANKQYLIKLHKHEKMGG